MFATIDIGTNSTLLLVGDTLPDGRIRIAADEARVSRLGQGLSSRENLNEDAIERTISTLKEYRQICDKHGVSSTAAVGTAALREARNANVFLSRVKEELDLEVEIISPEREAWLTFVGSSRDFGQDILVCDIGGGSTELIWGKPPPAVSKTAAGEGNITPAIPKGGEIHHEECQFLTIPIGSVLLTEQYVKTDPIAAEEFRELCIVIDRQLNHSLLGLSHRHADRLVATAGTATTLAAIEKKLAVFDHKKIHGCVLEMLDIQVIVDILKAKTIAERKKIPGLQHGREDVILAGAVILDRVMRRLGYDIVTISDRGLRWGLFYERFASKPPY
jgi:exopolyphosphatase/guanosine-5'-triphosphate,3'-diphosphate pyrophosphatase